MVGSGYTRSITVDGRTLPGTAIQSQEPGERRTDLGDDLPEARVTRQRSQVARRIFLFTVDSVCWAPRCYPQQINRICMPATW
jgi:hypothetical protein